MWPYRSTDPENPDKQRIALHSHEPPAPGSRYKKAGEKIQPNEGRVFVRHSARHAAPDPAGPRKREKQRPTPHFPRRPTGGDILTRTHSETGSDRHKTTIRTRRSEEHTSELQSRENLVCRLLLEK